jgi:hypothetical protein
MGVFLLLLHTYTLSEGVLDASIAADAATAAAAAAAPSGPQSWREHFGCVQFGPI